MVHHQLSRDHSGTELPSVETGSTPTEEQDQLVPSCYSSFFSPGIYLLASPSLDDFAHFRAFGRLVTEHPTYEIP